MSLRHDIWPFIVWTFLRVDIRSSEGEKMNTTVQDAPSKAKQVETATP